MLALCLNAESLRSLTGADPAMFAVSRSLSHDPVKALDRQD
jgi:hypothetical protein